MVDQPVQKKRNQPPPESTAAAPSIPMKRDAGAEYEGVRYVDSISAETLTVAELLFNREISKEEHDE